MYVPYSIVNPLTIVQISRRLPRPGDILVGVGDTVEPAHIVAQTVRPADFRIINVARELNAPLKKVKNYIKVERGERVSEGDVLAARGGLSGGSCRAPIGGTIVGSGRGRLLLEADPQPIRLNALVPGVVVDTWPSEGVLIETVGAYIQAAWGNGLEAYGPLRVIARAPRHPLRPKHIDPASQGAILVGGARLDEETIERAVEMQVRGIIVGGLPSRLLSLAEGVGFPIVATEGVGKTPMSKATFDLLRSLDGRDVALSAQLRPRWGAKRPYIVVPMPSEAGTPIDPDAPIVVGSRVRALRQPYRGASGEVIDIPPGMSQLETGARVTGVQVDFGRNEMAFIPYANLERLL